MILYLFLPFRFTSAISFPNSTYLTNYLQFIFCLVEFNFRCFKWLVEWPLQKVTFACYINFMISLFERNQKTTFLLAVRNLFKKKPLTWLKPQCQHDRETEVLPLMAHLIPAYRLNLYSYFFCRWENHSLTIKAMKIRCFFLFFFFQKKEQPCVNKNGGRKAKWH